MEYALSAAESEGTLEKASVIGVQGTALLVRTRIGVMRAERAAGCLLAPRGGDGVLVAVLPGGEAWVTCVLTRADGDAEIELPDRTALRARELSVETEKTSFASRVISMEGTLLSLGGGLLLQGFAAVQTVARRIGERAARKVARLGEVSQTTDGLDERSAGRMRVECESGYRLRAENADVRAKTLLDLDAERIKVG